jgi:hypothetical protein
MHALGVLHSVRKVRYLREIGRVEVLWLMTCVKERNSLVAYLFNVE